MRRSRGSVVATGDGQNLVLRISSNRRGTDIGHQHLLRIHRDHKIDEGSRDGKAIHVVDKNRRL